jgi:hypothetical protein
MKSKFAIAAAALMWMSQNPASAKAGEEKWVAYSRTAMSITGDILLSPTRLRAAHVNLPLKVAADNPRFGVDDGLVAARVLALTEPSNPKLLNGNTFGCDKPVRWIAVWQFDHGQQLGMAVFDSVKMPKSESDPGFCGSYYYARP